MATTPWLLATFGENETRPLLTVTENDISLGITSNEACMFPEVVRRLSPCLTEHVKRFGPHILDVEARPKPLQPKPLFVTTQ
jgi:hypothetical protein